MVNFHQINSRKDARDYIRRLSRFGLKFEQLLEGLRIREEKNIIPPKFVIEHVLDEMRNFIAVKASENILFVSFSEKLSKLAKIKDPQKSTLLKKCETEISKTVYPSYQKLIDYFEKLKTKATRDDGVWKLHDGDAYYEYRLCNATSLNILPEEVHQIGLSEVRRLEAEMRELLRSLGYSDPGKAVGEYMRELAGEERFHFSENDSGRAECLAEFKKLVENMERNLKTMFNVVPKIKVEVKRFPGFKEKTAPPAMYYPPALDGSRGGNFFVNLYSIKDITRFSMPTIAYHETVPGHHFQISIQQGIKNVPLFRKVLPFTAYVEGWALYAEKLVAEFGFYKDDPFGDLARLRDEMWRAARLVVDSGIHYKRWTREQAIDYMAKYTGHPERDVISEIERYIVWPGQACSYKIGMLKILELREKAKAALGPKFDIKDFHAVLLFKGSLPLKILENEVDKYVRSKT